MTPTGCLRWKEILMNLKLIHEIEVNEALVRYINLFFKERNINAIVSEKSDKIIMVIEILII